MHVWGKSRLWSRVQDSGWSPAAYTPAVWLLAGAPSALSPGRRSGTTLRRSLSALGAPEGSVTHRRQDDLGVLLTNLI